MSDVAMVRTTSKTGFTTYMEILGHYVGEAESKGKKLGLLLVELENLRSINMTMGYHVGRELLVSAADRLQSVCRSRDRVIQFGDQNFAILLAGIRNEGHAELAANKIWRKLNDQVAVGQQRLVLEISIGIAIFPGHASTAPTLMQAAETAQRAATSSTHWQVYSEERTAESTGLVSLQAELDSALRQGRLEMHYQPKIRLGDASTYGVEALMRWFHPERGAIRPDTFIGLAEKMGKIEPLTWFALNTALRQFREWPIQHGPFNVAVNMTPEIIQKPDFCEIVANALNVWDVAPAQLTLEITETALMTNPAVSFRTLSALRDLGVRISIDDFGTGYSSLSYFKNIPATELKIDRSFVAKMLDNPGDRQIVQVIIDLAHAFGLDVVAEGIEDQSTADALTSMGCQSAQGYFYGKPMSHCELVKRLSHADAPIEVAG